MRTTLSAVAGYTDGKLVGEDGRFDGVSTDTRSIGAGQVFVALAGPNFDGADYVAEAAARGAAGAVVGRRVDSPLPQVVVADTRVALGRLAAGWRREQPAVVVGITGSNGKTTLKELTAACLAEGGPTLATEGNLNNDIGVPLMMTRIEPVHRYAVLEMGANHIGEIAYLVELAEPDVVTITNAGDAHLEGFGSVEGIARGKGEILCGDPRPGVAVLNADDAYFDYWRKLASGSDIVSFGLDSAADVSAADIVAGAGDSRFSLRLPTGQVEIGLSLPGRHNVRNACAAAAIATALGLDPEQIRVGLEKGRPVGGRLATLRGPSGATIYDDSYNANPSSVVAAAQFLSSLPGTSVLVLGDMGELGGDAARMHSDVGVAAREAGVDRLLALGELSRHTVAGFGDSASWYADIDHLVDAARAALDAETNVLVKGSRFMRMERVVEALKSGSGEGG
jgi:UDP-N-acetylmuramoyl-tripeptide--D-alanyl-D-alanine ligase